jgi:integrase
VAITKYKVGGKTMYRVSLWVFEGGKRRHKKKGRIPTHERAAKLEAEWRAKSFDGTWFDRGEELKYTVKDAWEAYEKASRQNDSHGADKSRSAHILRHLGGHAAARLTQAEVDGYRAARREEHTRRGTKPSDATLDREVELLKRFLGYATACHKLRVNPLAGVALLNTPNTRSVTLTEEEFQAGLKRFAELDVRTRWAVPVLLTAWDTGMRIGEVIKLRRDQIDWKTGRVALGAADTKQERAKAIFLSERALEALKAIPAHLKSPWVFWSGPKGRRRTLPRRGFHQAFGDGVWVHDLRRSFATDARRKGIPESVVMKMGGWKTPAVFRRYNIVDEADVRAAAEHLEATRTAPPAEDKSKKGGA